MTLIFDASVAVKWFVAEPDSPVARAARASALRALAPDLIIAEAMNAAWLGHRRGQLTESQFAEVASELPRFFDVLMPLAALAPRAGAIARQLDHPVYHCFYLTLAEREVVSMVTADGRFCRRVAGTPWAPLVRPLASFATP